MIKFGTAGWRAIIGDEFTFHNVRMVSQAICNYLKRKEIAPKGIVIGYDTRFLSEKLLSAINTVFIFLGGPLGLSGNAHLLHCSDTGLFVLSHS